jgi:hypothetical protein
VSPPDRAKKHLLHIVGAAFLLRTVYYYDFHEVTQGFAMRLYRSFFSIPLYLPRHLPNETLGNLFPITIPAINIPTARAEAATTFIALRS